ncbi:neuronal PAS domain-containing protein 2-like isoform X1 [Carassius carassius]|uniref:neuronal PAS domain-containing protein 2-like isoform X1 n=1 Tax=Carassius carassius TaxID=217509 RepID=UPI002868FB73|nr:neuronal PAS domain-containing protein 2-like isoform X1 [Carassius carassius]XP_059404496.1 neuronal PAS domain-containing protein 2-like isoform X1 [Carassius carassius]
MGEGVSMDNLSEFGGLCPSTRREWDTGSCVDDLMDEDEKDRAKRASRNKSEKKRRDQFNVLIKELCTMLQGQGHPRKMDKSTILQRTIDFLQKQKEITAQTESCEVRQDWKPSFLSNEEFTQLMLEALDGFLIALTTDGNIIYVSDSVSSLIGHLPSDMVDQNILNFLPEREHGEVYKLLSSHMLLTEPSALDLLSSNEMHVEFCCHVARGNIDPKEPPTYEYVKFVGDFKFHNNAVPLSSCNGYELAFPRTLQSSLEEQICLIATVRLVTPQFLKDLCNVEDVCDEFTSRHSLEWKFLFLDHRASPIIGYLPFEVLGTSGYDYYHVDDLELISQCHKQLMQCGKGKSCYYRFLTKGQQWIWLQTHYYITYHQWNSKPEFIVCTHSVVSYAEVRAERRREFGLEESSSDMATSSIKGQEVFLDMCPPLDATRERISSARSVSSQSSRKSSHTALSDSASNSSVRFTEACTSSRQSVSIGPEKSTSRMPHSGSKALIQRQSSSEPTSLSPSCSQHSTMTQSLYGFQQPQLGVMHQLKEQLEERTRILQADIKTQQQELHDIKEKLQLANIQMLLQQPIQGEFSSSGLQQQGPGRLSQHSTHPKPQHCVSHSSRTLLREQPSSSSAQGQQRLVQTGHMQAISVPMQTHTSLTTPFYSNPMMFSPNHGHRTQTDTNSQRNTHTDYSQDGQLRMLLNQPMQMLVPDSSGGSQASQCSSTIQQTKYPLDQQMMPPSFPVQQVNCNAVLVPSPVFTSPIMIPHNSFITHQATPTYTPHPSAAPHLPLQQPQQFFQMQPQGLIHSAPTQALFHTTSIPQQSTVGYIQPQQQQHHHSQSGNLSDYRNMLTR